MELFEDDAQPGRNAPEFTVTEISGAVKRVIEGEFGRVRVRGELGRVSRPRSGHVYLDLKDDRSVLSAVIWKGVASGLATEPEEGLEVIATGRLTTFGGQSKYQMVIEDLAPAGMGALMAMLEKRRAALAAEGLFDAARKSTLPYLPRVIGVVTSPSGAVIRDILHRLRDRFPVHVIVWPVAVQGAACAPDVARAIRGFNALAPGGPVPRPDLLIVARGGGSVEDLWGFNEEIVVRAAAQSDIPLISAVGHETDTTLIDFAADLRAPTPTAAAELAVPVRLDLLAWADGQQARLGRALAQGVARRGQRLRDLARALPRPETLVGQAAQRLDTWGERLPLALRGRLTRARAALGQAGAGLRPRALSASVDAGRRNAARAAERLAPGLERGLARRRDRLAGLSGRLLRLARPEELRPRRQGLSALGARLDAAVAAGLSQCRRGIEAQDRLRQTLGYRATLRRGYAVVHGGDGVLTSRAAATASPPREIEFHDGKLPLGAGPAPAPAPAPRRKGGKPPPDQGRLF
jgi:exodeoxyribonuclease VII large subunit